MRDQHRPATLDRRDEPLRDAPGRACARSDAFLLGPDDYPRIDDSRRGLRLMTWDEWAVSTGERLPELY
jgi:hypothetical protein